MWSQVYDPFGNMLLSAAVAALPVFVLLGSIAIFEIKAHYAAILGLISALLVAVLGFGMPADMAAKAAGLGAAFGLMPIGWIILNVIFLYNLTNEKGDFERLQVSIRNISDDRRIQLLFIAFSLGAFFEGAAGFGTPVAVTAAMLIGLGFSPLAASGLSLIANTAPVAFGALGTPVIALSAVTGLDLLSLTAQVGRQLTPFCILVPFWLIWAFVGFRKMLEVWPPILVAGVSFAIPQYLISNYHGPWLVNVVAAICSMGALALFLKFWKPANPMTDMPDHHAAEDHPGTSAAALTGGGARVWAPWVILSLFVFAWGVPQVKEVLNGCPTALAEGETRSTISESACSLTKLAFKKFPVPGLNEQVQKMPPVVTHPEPEKAVYTFNILSATGTSIFLASIVAAFVLGYTVPQMIRMYGKTIWMVRYSLLTIAAMLAIGYVTRYAGTDATMGLLLANTGFLYPFFGTMIGWLGVALTGSDTASNVLFGGLQKVSAQQLGLSPILMAAANSSGGVMGKMIDAQSIVVASTATKWYGNEGSILRFVFFHSVALACLVGLLVMAQAYMFPFMIVSGPVTP
ncbi:MAG: L-lactate permease [Hyphomicrobiaceae bacterium]|nr:L-lactate permease [Hyphomicrobiaceae bacterium]